MEVLPSPLSLWLLMHFLLANTDISPSSLLQASTDVLGSLSPNPRDHRSSTEWALFTVLQTGAQPQGQRAFTADSGYVDPSS